MPAEQAEAIGAQLHRRVELAGVFVNAPLDELAATADVCRFSLLQLHGDEGPAYCQEAARRTGCRVVKAARVHDAAQIQALRAYHTDYHLLDAHSPKAPGGTGESFDWELARRHPGTPPVILSGGLTPDNVAQAIAAARPVRRGHGERHRGRAGPQGPRQAGRFFRAVETTGNVVA